MQRDIRPGPVVTLLEAVTATTSIMIPNGAFARDLLVLHVISTATTGGRCSLQNCADAAGTTAVAHHGAGNNIQSANQTVSYSSIFYDCSEHAKLTLTVSNGSHDVYCQWIG